MQRCHATPCREARVSPARDLGRQPVPYPDFQKAPPARTNATMGPSRTANLRTVRIFVTPPPIDSPMHPFGLSTSGLWLSPDWGSRSLLAYANSCRLRGPPDYGLPTPSRAPTM